MPEQHCDRPPPAAEFDKLSSRGYGAQFSIAQQINHYQRAILLLQSSEIAPGRVLKGHKNEASRYSGR